jgi:hypothetical protein
MPSYVQTTVTLPGATSLLDAIAFLDHHGPELERLLSAALGPVAEDLVGDLAAAVRKCDLDTARIQIDTMIDTLDGMMGEPALSAESPSFDTALGWYLTRLYDLAKTFRDI